jgi:ParB-like chromosome segregation protein Spo0J
MSGVEAQPLAQVEWVPRASLTANDYNPNRVAPPELALLKLSILENGWTQPIVTHSPDQDGTAEIVDGFHRWTVSADPDVAALTGGLVPVVRLAQATPELARMATIRHNRARGTHYVLRMADLVVDLIDTYHLDAEEVGRRLQMDPEEVSRLYDRGDMRKRASAGAFNNGWKPG